MTTVTLSQSTPFDRIGGTAAVDRLVEAFYGHMDHMPEAAGIRAMHPANLAPIKAVLKLYLAEWMGGPKAYSEARGHPRLRMRHIRFPIGPSERDQWMACMNAALDDEVPDAQLRKQLGTAFLKLADWVRNDPDNPHDRS